jgi:hypothetical protein
MLAVNSFLETFFVTTSFFLFLAQHWSYTASCFNFLLCTPKTGLTCQLCHLNIMLLLHNNSTAILIKSSKTYITIMDYAREVQYYQRTMFDKNIVAHVYCQIFKVERLRCCCNIWCGVFNFCEIQCCSLDFFLCWKFHVGNSLLKIPRSNVATLLALHVRFSCGNIVQKFLLIFLQFHI